MAILLPSGRFVDANLDLVSVDTEGTLYGGYDSHLCDSNGEEAEDWPVEDRIALANIMLGRWQAYLVDQVTNPSIVNKL